MKIIDFLEGQQDASEGKKKKEGRSADYNRGYDEYIKDNKGAAWVRTI